LLPWLQQALLQAATKDADEGCRTAAREALAALPLDARVLLPLLSLTDAAVGAAAGVDASQLDDDEELQQLQAAAAAAAVVVTKLGTPAKQRRGKPSQERASAEEAARAAVEAVERRRQQLAEQRVGRRKGRQAAEASAHGAGASGGTSAGSESCEAALELLQWKDNVQQRPLLIPAVQDILAQLLAMLSSSASAEEQPALDEPAPAASSPAAELVYMVQLCLAALTGIARTAQQQQPMLTSATQTASKTKAKGGKKQHQQQHQEGEQVFDLHLVVRAAQLAPDGAVRNAALELISVLAQAMPQVRCSISRSGAAPCAEQLVTCLVATLTVGRAPPSCHFTHAMCHGNRICSLRCTTSLRSWLWWANRRLGRKTSSRSG